ACGVLKVNEADTAAGILSDVWSFVAEGAALHQPAQISFAVPDADSSSVGTLLIARVAKDGKLVAEGGRYEDGEVTARVGFGTYCVAADTVAPKITPALGKENRTSDTGRFSVKLTDDFSGVKDFRVEVDGVWALSMFKSGRITVWLDKERHGRGSHKVKVTATDACNNKSEKNFNIIW
ncbi:MAG: hypothetical protein HUJ93_08970, partial [Bacteroidales bacterium]|nr:hypothetical protein [Bacteroidales bacterium]